MSKTLEKLKQEMESAKAAAKGDWGAASVAYVNALNAYYKKLEESEDE